MKTLDFWRIVIGFYPMAVFPLGLWAAVLGAGGTRALEAIALRSRIGFNLMLLGSCISGAMAGLIFMVVFTSTAILTGAGVQPDEGLLPFALAGLIAGAFSGLASAFFAHEGSTPSATASR